MIAAIKVVIIPNLNDMKCVEQLKFTNARKTEQEKVKIDAVIILLKISFITNRTSLFLNINTSDIFIMFIIPYINISVNE